MTEKTALVGYLQKDGSVVSIEVKHNADVRWLGRYLVSVCASDNKVRAFISQGNIEDVSISKDFWGHCYCYPCFQIHADADDSPLWKDVSPIEDNFENVFWTARNWNDNDYMYLFKDGRWHVRRKDSSKEVVLTKEIFDFVDGFYAKIDEDVLFAEMPPCHKCINMRISKLEERVEKLEKYR